MKKFILFLLILSITINTCFAAEWIEIFKKQYVDMESVQYNKESKIIKFWVKQLRKDPKDTYKNKPYWYRMHELTIDCNSRKIKINSVAIYDLKNNLMDYYNNISDFESIIPDTYSEGYYDIFCSVPLEELK